MIRALYDRQAMRISVTGHAGYAPHGQDIVCAGASTLYYTLRAALEAEAEAGRGSVIERDGEIGFVAADGSEERARLIMDTVWQGYELLARQYGTYIKAEKTG